MKKRGFTLIELLAVIIILAVIALIATPLVMNIIEESRKSSFRVSVENMIRAMETDQATQGFIPLSYQFPLDADTTLKLDGKIDDWQGKSSIDEDGNTAVSIYNGTYCAYKKKDDNSVSVEKVSSEKECLDFTNPILPVMMEGELASIDMETVEFDPGSSKFLNGPITREEIESIRINNTKEVPGTVLGSFDVSESQNESVIAYYSDNDSDGLYEVVIGGEGGVLASTNARFLFGALYNVTTIDLSNFDTSQVTDMYAMLAVCPSLTELNISNFDTSQVANMSYMFTNCKGLTKLNLSDFNTSKVTNMSYMFADCSSLTELDLSNFNTSKVTNMGNMFYMCQGLTELDLSNFNTSKVTDMASMFEGCSSLTELNVSNFNTSKVTDMNRMFSSCGSLTKLDLSSFDTLKVTNMGSMFSWCISLTELNVSNFNTSQVTDMRTMFYSCGSLTSLDLRNMTFDSVTSYSSMFSNITSGITVTVKDSSAKTFIESRLSEASVTGTVTIAS